MATSNNVKKAQELVKVRGTGVYNLQAKSFEFTAQGDGKPQRENQKKYGNASSYDTVGAKPKHYINLVCEKDALNPAEELTSQLETVLKEEYNQKLPEHLKPVGLVLKKEPDFVMTVNQAKKVLAVSFSVSMLTEGNRDYSAKVMEKITEVSKCLAINETKLRKLR